MICSNWYWSKYTPEQDRAPLPVSVVRRETTLFEEPVSFTLPFAEINERRRMASLADLFVWNWGDRRSVYTPDRSIFRNTRLKTPCISIARRVVSFLSSRDANGLLTASRAHASTLSLIVVSTPSQHQRLQFLREAAAACSTAERMTEQMVAFLLAHTRPDQSIILSQPSVQQERFLCHAFSVAAAPCGQADNERCSKTARYSENPTVRRLLFRGNLPQQVYRQLLALGQDTSSQMPFDHSAYEDSYDWLPHTGDLWRSGADLHGRCYLSRMPYDSIPRQPFDIVLPVCWRDLAHAVLKELALCHDVASFLQLGKSRVLFDGAKKERGIEHRPKDRSLPVTHATAWLLLGLCESVWLPDSFLSRVIPLSELSSAVASQLIPPVVACPWEDVLSIVAPFIAGVDVAQAGVYRPVSRLFAAAIDTYLRSLARIDFVPHISHRSRGSHSQSATEAFVRRFALATASTTLILGGLRSIPPATFADLFSTNPLHNLLELRFCSPLGLCDDALCSLFQSAPQLQTIR